MSEDLEIAKDRLSIIVMPMLIAVIGFFLVNTLKQISNDISDLKQTNIERDIWVRDWIETWQPTLDWARGEKEYQLRYGRYNNNFND